MWEWSGSKILGADVGRVYQGVALIVWTQIIRVVQAPGGSLKVIRLLSKFVRRCERKNLKDFSGSTQCQPRGPPKSLYSSGLVSL